jgi:hypothetical protein
VPEALDPLPLLRCLSERGVEHIIIGGFAVNAHGHVRSSKDLDVVPNPVLENLERLATALTDVNARDAEAGDFDLAELPRSATRTADLAQGGNFRLTTDLGDLDIMQWVRTSKTSSVSTTPEVRGSGMASAGTTPAPAVTFYP